MSTPLRIKCASFRSIDSEKGLIGFAELVINDGFVVNSIAVYAKKAGGIRLLYPDKRGRIICHPTNKLVSRQIEEIVLDAVNNVRKKGSVCDDRYDTFEP